MARYKGKSKRRIKNWHQRVVAGGEADDTTDDRRLGFSKREVKLPAERLEAAQENLDDLPRAEGMVVGLYRRGCVVRTGQDELLCGIAKTFRAPESTSPLAVGDVVTVALTHDQHRGQDTERDRLRADGFIVARQPRRSALTRPQPRGAKRTDPHTTEIVEKVIAANIDVLVIVASMRQPRLHRGLIDRFLIVAERGELTPVLVFNKIDLARPEAALLKEFKSLDVQVVPCSAETRKGLRGLRAALKDKAGVMAGPSGVGKTSLINALIPGADGAVREIRAKDERGRHTTSASVVYDVPGGGIIIDTPGIRELALPLTAEELPWYFPEFEELSPQCKFNNCTHTHEPQCAVLAAVEAGDLPAHRYESYVRILETIEDAH